MPSGRFKGRALFLDRDGVINASPGRGHVTTWRQFRFLPGSLRALAGLCKEPFKVIVVSNQSAVGRGLLTEKGLREITRRMLEEIRSSGGRIDAVYYCTHRPEAGCSCRKPSRGLLDKAARRFSIDLKRSTVIGDDLGDIQMGRSAGCLTILVLSGKQTRATAKSLPVKPDWTAGNLGEALQRVLQKGERR